MSETKQADGEEIVAVTAKAFPHTEWICHLQEQMLSRVLTKAEVISVIEANIFEAFITDTLPRLKVEVDACPEGDGKQNARMFLAVAVDFTKGWAHDLVTQMQRSGWAPITSAVVQ